MADQVEQNADWGRVFSEAVAVLRPLAGRDAERIVDEAMVLLFAHKVAPRPPGETLAGHLAKVGLHAWRVRQRLDRKHRHPRGLRKLLISHDLAAATPEDPTARGIDEQRKARLFEDLRAQLESDREACDVLARVREGVTGAAAQAAALGLAVEVVREARRRIKVRMDAMVAFAADALPASERDRARAEEMRP